jgi:hypothetical protein
MVALPLFVAEEGGFVRGLTAGMVDSGSRRGEVYVLCAVRGPGQGNAA